MKYLVSIPIAGAIHITVEAPDPTVAKEVAWDLVNEKGERAGEIEWEFFESIAEGNACYARFNEITVSKVKR